MKLSPRHLPRVCLGISAFGALLLAMLVMGLWSPISLPNADATYTAIVMYLLWAGGFSIAGLVFGMRDTTPARVRMVDVATIAGLSLISIGALWLFSRLFGDLILGKLLGWH